MKVGATGLVTLLATALALFVAGVAFAGPADSDGDGVVDDVDNCPAAFNPSQTNSDVASDSPGDSLGDACDNCRDVCNTTQVDSNSDGCGNQCDPDVVPTPINDGAVGIPDYTAIVGALGMTVPPASADLDLTSGAGACGALGRGLPDLIVGIPDYTLTVSSLGMAPGPGLPPDTNCDGTP